MSFVRRNAVSEKPCQRRGYGPASRSLRQFQLIGLFLKEHTYGEFLPSVAILYIIRRCVKALRQRLLHATIEPTFLKMCLNAQREPTKVCMPAASLGSVQFSYSALMAIFFVSLMAFAVFGRVTVSTPFLNVASALSVSTSRGSGIVRLKDPYERSIR